MGLNPIAVVVAAVTGLLGVLLYLWAFGGFDMQARLARAEQACEEARFDHRFSMVWNGGPLDSADPTTIPECQHAASLRQRLAAEEERRERQREEVEAALVRTMGGGDAPREVEGGKPNDPHH
ncbi:MAG: hypothetical protein QJR02_11360 [Sinobacteraceae bacterium]|nr:hypothetical protein [Nevskiaceae bacterium]